MPFSNGDTAISDLNGDQVFDSLDMSYVSFLYIPYVENPICADTCPNIANPDQDPSACESIVGPMLLDQPPVNVPDVVLPAVDRTIEVYNVAQLRDAIEGGADNTLVRVHDGDYPLSTYLRINGLVNFHLVGASKDPTKVRIRGEGFTVNKDLLRISNSSRVTLAYLTFQDTGAYGVKVEAENHPEDITIWNCHFLEIATRMIKGSGTDAGDLANRGQVQYSYFKNTQVKSGTSNDDYTGAIDHDVPS